MSRLPCGMVASACRSQARGWVLPGPTGVLPPCVRGKASPQPGTCLLYSLGIRGRLTCTAGDARVPETLALRRTGCQTAGFCGSGSFCGKTQEAGGVCGYCWSLVRLVELLPLSVCCRSREPVPAGGALHPPLAIIGSAMISPRCLSSSGSLNETSPDSGN